MRKFRMAAVALLGLCSLSLASAALAQDKIETAPKIDSISPTGVSYGTGAFTYELPLLSIGAGIFPQAMQLMLLYRSDAAHFPNSAWATNLNVRISMTRTDPASEPCPSYCNPGDYTYTWNFVVGQRSAGFYKTGAGAGPGPYTPQQLDGSSLKWEGSGTGFGGNFTYTSSEGTQVKFEATEILSEEAATPLSWIEADGTELNYGASSYGKTISSNRGLALFFEASTGATGNMTQRICALNLTQFYLPSLTTCPAGTPTATLHDSNGGTEWSSVESVVDSAGKPYSFTYGGRGHLTCIKESGQTDCKIQNSYDTCDEQGTLGYYDEWFSGSRDRVISQTFATGETYTFAYVSGINMPPGTAGCRGNVSATMTQGGIATTIIEGGSTPTSIRDPLNRVSTMTWIGPRVSHPAAIRPASYTSPEGDLTQYTYDARGNITEIRQRAKPGSGLADIVTNATYAASCTVATIRTCNKPLTRTDARGNVTTYTYDAAHGAVLSEVGASVNAVSPAKKYGYVQRYAWIANGSGGFMHAASPVWLRSEERSCRTTTLNTSSGTCAGGAADEVITSYDYGPDTGAVGNNLWLRGKVVTAQDADGVIRSYRTCYGYDPLGNKIWETSPRAGLSACY